MMMIYSWVELDNADILHYLMTQWSAHTGIWANDLDYWQDSKDTHYNWAMHPASLYEQLAYLKTCTIIWHNTNQF